ncbi:Rho guanyl-nucleotide exchange factor activity protein [Halocaridina rubra]|uniref:Rho guanyl-nucleotide exchange factor activity protein n=1 Tax=Halocaridina rubra TaxID=373956 RepID=A0AAN8X8X6_HALRR
MSTTVRKKIIEEMVSSEEAYLKQLNTLDKYFIKPSLEKELFPQSIHTMVFGQLLPIREMSLELYRSLCGESSDIGTAFLQLAPFLKVYSSYAKNYQQAINLLVDHERKADKFKAWLAVQESRPEVQTKLPSLLITPIQRVPRYRLLLGQLLKHTSDDHPDYCNISSANQAVDEVASHIEDSIKKAECVQRMLKIQEALKSGQPNIIAPGRLLIREGILQKVSRTGKNSQPRLFFLFTDILMYTKLASSNLNNTANASFSEISDVYKSRSLECCCLLPVRHCSVTSVFSSEGGLFRLKCKTEDMLLFSSDHGTSTEWVKDINEAIRKANEKRKTLRKDSSSRRPMRKVAIKKMTIKENKELLALKVTKPADGIESPSSRTDSTQSSSDSSEEMMSDKKPWSPCAILSQIRQVHECLTPPRMWHSRKRPKLPDIDDDDIKKKVKMS